MRVEETEDYRAWINGIVDLRTRARIQVRVDRLVHGNPGDSKHLSGGVSELRIDVGPGYRVYYTKRGNRIIILLAGGDKSTQTADIKRAISMARDYEE